MLSSWLPLAATALLWQGATGGAAMDLLGAALDGRWDASALRWALSGLLLLTLLASAYLAVCAWLSLAQRLQRQDEAAAAQTQRLREMSARQSSVLAEAQAAMALQQAVLRAAVGELARRTVALCGMLDAGVGDAARAAADLEAIQDEERHALQLMSSLRARLLSLAQHCQALGDAASAAAPSQLDAAPGSVMNEAAQRRELQIQARHLNVLVDAPELKLMLDNEKMSVVLDNLLSNAVDFSPEGGEVLLRATFDSGVLKIECIDHGPGVADEDKLRIFDPFVQGRRLAPLPRKGSGVGLSIVRELVRAMGGSVALQSSELGAHFCVEIPKEK